MLWPLRATSCRGVPRFFVNLDDFIADVKQSVPDATSILEVGCGEGAICQRLQEKYPASQVTGIDITPNVGRLFQGSQDRVRFINSTIQDYAPQASGIHDLILIADVLHHVPWSMHDEFLQHVTQTLAPDGWLIIKDWERRLNPIHALGYFSDRVLTGDKIRYGRLDDLKEIAIRTCGSESIQKVARYKPWPNNVALFLRPKVTSIPPQ